MHLLHSETQLSRGGGWYQGRWLVCPKQPILPCVQTWSLENVETLAIVATVLHIDAQMVTHAVAIHWHDVQMKLGFRNPTTGIKKGWLGDLVNWGLAGTQ